MSNKIARFGNDEDLLSRANGVLNDVSDCIKVESLDTAKLYLLEDHLVWYINQLEKATGLSEDELTN